MSLPFCMLMNDLKLSYKKGSSISPQIYWVAGAARFGNNTSTTNKLTIPPMEDTG
jgi:hypothetical protein